MKILTIFRSKWMVLAGMVFLLPLLAGCGEDGLPDEEGAEVPLSRVPHDPGFASIPLIGPKWKLVGFVDGRRNRIKLAKPFLDNSYTLIFKEDGVLEGYTSTNRVWTGYILEPPLEENTIDLSLFGPSTYAGETDEGYLYTELMERVYAYRISSKGLELYHDSLKYLLFKPME